MTPGCGGGAFTKPVPTTVIIERPNGADVNVVVTRSNQPITSTDSCSFTHQPDWCGMGTSRLDFNVQPSFVAYRVYLVNNASTPVTIRATATRDDDDEETIVTIPAKSSVYTFEMGTTFIHIKAGT